ncbi:short chain dehydrogenase [Hirsutella rhossiliensis]|uniref:3beta-hydroxysteroid 3-dehydrogenase n=1 Tax=Hirsutella rhossiliensis TaxID=111463 RepID=A0A9P8SNJ1_9HYPO|nr:short chain dehydrogenase domain-containing protein [Hirsutella rhossiliensis]KAH0967221.1 short chain dehydrogenase domain-containing protein [Hirsutella rhossiliensis]
MSSPSSKGCVLVTGANGGLGSAIVSHLLGAPDLASGYTGIYTVRKAAGASRLQSVLQGAPAAHRHETLELDLGSLASVRQTASQINRRVASGELPRIRALILNAGYQDQTSLAMSDDGFEMTWQVNFLVNFVLSLLLLQSMDEHEGRILIISSWAHDIEDKRNGMGGNTVYQDPKWPTLFPDVDALAKGRWSTPEDEASWHSGFRRYGASKLCAIMLIHELAARLARDPKLSSIAVIGLDPGGMGSDILRRGSFFRRFITMKVTVPLLAAVLVRLSPNAAVRPMWKSAADVVRACFEIKAPPSGAGALYLNGTEELETARDARDADKRRALWRYGLEAAGIGAEDTALADWQ